MNEEDYNDSGRPMGFFLVAPAIDDYLNAATQTHRFDMRKRSADVLSSSSTIKLYPRPLKRVKMFS